jgi:hypothetical protein
MRLLSIKGEASAVWPLRGLEKTARLIFHNRRELNAMVESFLRRLGSGREANAIPNAAVGEFVVLEKAGPQGDRPVQQQDGHVSLWMGGEVAPKHIMVVSNPVRPDGRRVEEQARTFQAAGCHDKVICADIHPAAIWPNYLRNFNGALSPMQRCDASTGYEPEPPAGLKSGPPQVGSHVERVV